MCESPVSSGHISQLLSDIMLKWQKRHLSYGMEDVTKELIKDIDIFAPFADAEVEDLLHPRTDS